MTYLTFRNKCNDIMYIFFTFGGRNTINSWTFENKYNLYIHTFTKLIGVYKFLFPFHLEKTGFDQIEFFMFFFIFPTLPSPILNIPLMQ